MAKVRILLEVNIDDREVSAEDIAKGIHFVVDDVVDGYTMTTKVAGYDNTVDFFITGIASVEKELIT